MAVCVDRFVVRVRKLNDPFGQDLQAWRNLCAIEAAWLFASLSALVYVSDAVIPFCRATPGWACESFFRLCSHESKITTLMLRRLSSRVSLQQARLRI